MSLLHMQQLSFKLVYFTRGLSHICFSIMTSEAKKIVFVSLPRKYWADYSQKTPLDHGLFIKNLNPYMSERYIQDYFREYGTITLCEKFPRSELAKEKTMAFVRFSTEQEADRAEFAGPHNIGGEDVIVNRVVCEKIEETSATVTHAAPVKILPSRSRGLGYLLEDSHWLDDN